MSPARTCSAARPAENRPIRATSISQCFSRLPPPATLVGADSELAAAIERRVKRPVDLIVVNRASPDLIHRILRDGILVLERDPSARIAFEVRARNEYFDVLPYLQEYRRAAGGAGK